jgi:predicted Fe-Mo cluster-binding NifX family protein
MKVAISSDGKDLESLIDSRFGRCPYFLIVETDDMSFEVLDNQSRSLRGGAGIQTAQFVASRGAKVLVTGYCGPNALRVLSAAGIEIFAGNTGTVKDALETLKKGRPSPTTETDVSGISGPGIMSAGHGPGMGGRGRMGRGNRAQGFTGRGRGMGGGQRMGRWA